MPKFLILAILATFTATASADTATPAPPDGALVAPDASQAPPAGSGSAVSPVVVVVNPAAAVADPAEHPLQAWDDARAAKRTSWPLAVFAVLLMITKALAYAEASLTATPVIGPAAKWLAVGKRAMIVAGVGALAAAGYNVLFSGGSLVAALFAAAVAVAGALHSTTQPPEKKA